MSDIKSLMKSQHRGIIDAWQTKKGFIVICKNPKTAKKIAIDFLRAGLKNAKIEVPNQGNPYAKDYVIFAEV